MGNGRGEVLSLIELAVEKGYLLPEAAEEARSELDDRKVEQMSPGMLVEEGFLTESELSQLQKESSDDNLPPLSDLGLAEDEQPAVPATPDIPGYEELELIGRGGMGLVYRAVQASPRRRVAVKVLTAAHFSGQQKRKRFQREAQAAASLSHPAIPSVYEFGEVDGIPYFTMEYIDGLQLDSYLVEHEPEKRHLVRLLRDLCEGVGVAHQRGIIHRDLKHANILITHGDQVKILDFGLAKLTEENGQQDVQTLTMEGQVMGTTPYMAPEQTRGDTEAIEARADVYALGVIMYESFTGQLPHEPNGDSRTELMERIRTEKVTRPRKLNSDVDRDLEKIIMKCLSKDRPLRYATAAAVAEDLNRYLGNRPIMATPPGPVYRLKKWVARHGLAVVSVLITMVGFIALTSLGWWTLQQAESRAQALQERLRRRANISSGTSQREAGVAIGLQTAINHHRNALFGPAADSLRDAYTTQDHWMLGYLHQAIQHKEAHKLASIDVPPEAQIAWSSDGAVLGVFGTEQRFYRWTADGSAGSERLEDADRGNWPELTDGGPRPIAVGNRTFLTVNRSDGTVRTINLDDKSPELHQAGTVPEGVNVLAGAASSDRYLLVTRSSPAGKQAAYLWVIPQDGGKSRKKLELPAATERAEISPDGSRILTSTADGELRLHKIASAEAAERRLSTGWTRRLSSAPTFLAFGGAPGFVIAGTASGEVALINPESGESAYTLQAPSPATAVAAEPGRPLLATVHRDAVVRVWNLERGDIVTAIGPFRVPPISVQFSPRGNLLAIGGEESITTYRWSGRSADSSPAATGVDSFWVSSDNSTVVHDGEAAPGDASSADRAVRLHAMSDLVRGVKGGRPLGFGASSEIFYIMGASNDLQRSGASGLKVVNLSLPHGFQLHDYVPSQGLICGLHGGQIEIRRVPDLALETSLSAPEGTSRVDLDGQGEYCAIATSDGVTVISLTESPGRSRELWQMDFRPPALSSLTYTEWLASPTDLALGSENEVRLIHAEDNDVRISWLSGAARPTGLLSLSEAGLSAVLTDEASLSLFRDNQSRPIQTIRWRPGVRRIEPIGAGRAGILLQNGVFYIKTFSLANTE